MKITLRKAKREDLSSLIKLWWELINYHKKIATISDNFYSGLKPETEETIKKFFKKNILGKKSLALVAEDNKKIIGYCLAQIKENIPIFKINKYGYISDLLVEKSYRGKGIGKKLLDEAKKFFKKHKLKFMELKVAHNNYHSISFYQNYGFKEAYKLMRIKI